MSLPHMRLPMNVVYLKRLVGNPRAYARQSKDGQWYPVREPLTAAVLGRHLVGKDLTVGTYLLDRDQCRTLVFDIDSGEESEAHQVRDALVELGVPSLHSGIEFSGRRGYHVWVVPGAYVQAKDLRRLGRAVLAETGLNIEVYPKQDQAQDLGNLIALPGGVHQMTGNRREFITPLPIPLPVSLFETVMEGIPELRLTVGGHGPPAPFHCMEMAQEGISEGGRNVGLFHLAIMARRGGLSRESVEMVVRAANERANPPLEEHELATIIGRADQSGPLCNQLSPSMHCGEACVLTRVAGLKTRAGQVRHAAEGERVVVTIGNRTANLVEFVHEDLVDGKGALK